MNLSSRTTYVFPFILLLVPALYFNYFTFGLVLYLEYFKGYFLLFILASILSALFFFLFKKYVDLFSKYKYLKYAFIPLPILLSSLVPREDDSIYFALVAGAFLFFSFIVFANRYTAILTDTSIEYKNLLGQPGEISLTDIVKIEQKQNILSIFREFRLLNLARKTGITFTDENYDEYEINIFTKVFKGNQLFSSIIENANKCGNLKIRQYEV